MNNKKYVWSANKILIYLIALFMASIATFGITLFASRTFVLAEENAIEQMSVNLSDDITAKFWVNTSKIGDGAYITIDFNGKNSTLTDYTVDGDYAVYSFEGITPQYLCEDITVNFYPTGSSEIPTGEITKSVKDYLKAVIDNGANGVGLAKYDAMNTLIADLLNYGAYSQEYVATSEISAENKADFVIDGYAGVIGGNYQLPTASDMSVGVADENTKNSVRPTTAKLILNNKVEMIFSFDIAEGSAVSDIALYKNGNVDERVVNKTISNGKMTVSFDVSVTEFSSIFKVVAKNGNTEIGRFAEYSVNSYVFNKQNDANPALSGLVKAIYSYGKSAEAYKALDNSATLSNPSVDVVLFIGESNMVGMAENTYDATIADGYAYEYKIATDSIVKLQSKVGESYNSVTVASSGSSIVSEFCREYSYSTGRRVVAVHIANNGKAIANFVKGTALYNLAVEKYNKAVACVESEGFTVDKKFYVMYQGESNATAGSSYNGLLSSYISSYTDFHTNILSECNLEFGAMIESGNRDANATLFLSRINTAQETLAQTTSETKDSLIICNKEVLGYVDNVTEYYQSNDYYLNLDGLNAVGKESAKNIVNYLGLGEDASLSGVDPVTYLDSTIPSYTLTLSGDVQFANGSTQKSVAIGAFLPAVVTTGENADNSVIAWEDSDGAGYSDNDFYMPYKNTTLTAKAYGSKSVSTGAGRIDFGFMDFATTTNGNYAMTLTEKGYEIINNNFARRYNGVIKNNGVSSGDNTQTSATFRVQTGYGFTNTSVYDFTFKNYGEAELNFNMYFRNSGSDKSTVEYFNILISAGETKTFAIAPTLATYNTLTYFKFETVPQSIDFAVAVIARNTSIVTLGGNATFADGSASKTLTIGSALPETVVGENFIGWANGDGVIYSTYYVTKDDVTLTPVYNTETYVTENDGKLNIASGSPNYSNYANSAVAISGYDWVNGELAKKLIINAVAGATTSDATQNNAHFRLQTPYSVKQGSFTLNYTFKNFGSTTLNFSIFQRNSGSDTSTVTAKDVVIQSGEIKTVKIILNAPGTNGNFLTYFKFNESVTNGQLAVYAYVKVGTYYNITLNGSEFEDGSTVKQLKLGDTLPAITLIDEYADKTAKGYVLSDGSTQKFVAVGGTIPTFTDDLTLTPYYPVTSGNGDIDWSAGSIQNQWEAPVDSVVRTPYVVYDGKVGVNYVVTGNGNEYFRAMTTYAVSTAYTSTMTYTIKNTGSSAINLTVYEVNSGNSYSGQPNEIVTLEAGETTTFDLTFKFSNGNVMCFFMLNEDMTASSFWVSSSISIG